MSDRIVITGAGAVTALGLDRESAWNAVRTGASGIRPLTALEWPEDPAYVGGEAPILPGGATNSPREVRYLSRALDAALMEAGIEIVIISGAKSPSVTHRAKTLGIKEVHIGIEDKLTLLKELCETRQLSFEQLAYMGDDLPDLPILEVVGFPAAPADAHEKVLANEFENRGLNPRRGFLQGQTRITHSVVLISHSVNAKKPVYSPIE